MVQGNAPAVMLGHQRKRRRVDRHFRRQAEAERKALGERRLARAEVPDEAEKVAGFEQDAETCGKSAGPGGAVCDIGGCDRSRQKITPSSTYLGLCPGGR